jgi:hypothetical protein
LRGKELRERLFTRNGRHAVAQQNELLVFDRLGGRQEFGDDLFLKSRSEHALKLSPIRYPTGLSEAAPRVAVTLGLLGD